MAKQSSHSTDSSHKTHSQGSGNESDRSQHLSRTTTDHETIRKWAEERGAHPACVKRTGSNQDTGIIRLDFPGYSGSESLQEISWDEFFEKFDESDLALVYQEKTSTGERSNFNKLVRRDEAAEKHSRS